MSRNFRPMVETDVAEVFKIECDLFPDPWPVSAFLSEIRRGKSSFPFVVEEMNMIIGYVICWYFLDELHIGNIAVKRAEQGKGIGRFLLETIFHHFDEYKTAFLEVREDNQKAINLYKSYGFTIAYRRVKYYPNGENALVMVKLNR